MNIVLAHGIFGFRTLFGVDYFNGVKAFLESTFQATPIQVIVTGVAPAGRIELRGAELGKEILTALASGLLDASQKVHIIAHSMGGLDARFCLSPENAGNITAAARVASLSTISTPHRGSPIADVLTVDNLLDRLSRSLPSLTGPLQEALDRLDLSTAGLQDLTSRATADFNDRFPDHPEVRYFSYAGGGRAGATPTCALLRVPRGLITLRTQQENDGLVSVDSATWGEGLVEVWPADHADEIGHDLDGGPVATPRAFDHLARYQTIVARLRDL
jgi:triacylglycerol lipase